MYCCQIIWKYTKLRSFQITTQSLFVYFRPLQTNFRTYDLSIMIIHLLPLGPELPPKLYNFIQWFFSYYLNLDHQRLQSFNYVVNYSFRENGLEVLYKAFERCTSVLSQSSKVDDLAVLVCGHLTRFYAVASQFPLCREKMIEMPELVKNICRIFYYKVTTKSQ